MAKGSSKNNPSKEKSLKKSVLKQKLVKKSKQVAANVVDDSSSEEYSDVDDMSNVNLSNNDLNRIAEILSKKMNMSQPLSKPPSTIKDVPNNTDGQNVNSSSHNNEVDKVKNAHIRVQNLLESLDKHVPNSQDLDVNTQVQGTTSLSNSGQNNDMSVTGVNSNSSSVEGFHFSEEGLVKFISQVRNLSDEQSGNKKRKLDQHLSQNKVEKAEGSPLGAFGEIRHKSSLLAMSRQRDNISDWDSMEHGNVHTRLLKSGLNRSYNGKRDHLA